MKSMKEKFIIAVLGVMTLFGVIFGIWQTVEMTTLVFAGKTAEGEVVRIEIGRGRRGRTSHYPIVEFQANNQTYSIKGASWITDYKVGEKVSVIYREAVPQKGHIHTFVQIWMVPILAFVIAIIAGFAGWKRLKGDSDGKMAEQIRHLAKAGPPA